jgi:hypothetical protein
MSTTAQARLAIPFDPWHGGDPVPPWVLSILDQRAQLELAKVVINAHVVAAKAYLDAATQIQKVIGATKLPGK